MKIVLVLAVCLVAVWGEHCDKNDLVGTCDHTQCTGAYVVSCDIERQCVCHTPSSSGQNCTTAGGCTANCHGGTHPHLRDHCIDGKCRCGYEFGGLGGLGKYKRGALKSLFNLPDAV